MLALSLVPSAASGQDINEVMKWQTAKAVHYDVVAVYSGTAVIIQTGGPVRGAENATRIAYRHFPKGGLLPDVRFENGAQSSYPPTRDARVSKYPN